MITYNTCGLTSATAAGSVPTLSLQCCQGAQVLGMLQRPAQGCSIEKHFENFLQYEEVHMIAI